MLTSSDEEKIEIAYPVVVGENISIAKLLNFPHDKLIKALYWIWDAFDRANMGMFLIYSTAESVISHAFLQGNGVYVGVRRAEWLSGSKTTMDSFAGEPLKIEGDIATYDCEGVPVYLYIFDEDQSIISLDRMMYENEEFKLPNPYSRFIELHPWKE